MQSALWDRVGYVKWLSVCSYGMEYYTSYNFYTKYLHLPYLNYAIIICWTDFFGQRLLTFAGLSSTSFIHPWWLLYLNDPAVPWLPSLPVMTIRDGLGAVHWVAMWMAVVDNLVVRLRIYIMDKLYLNGASDGYNQYETRVYMLLLGAIPLSTEIPLGTHNICFQKQKTNISLVSLFQDIELKEKGIIFWSLVWNCFCKKLKGLLFL